MYANMKKWMTVGAVVAVAVVTMSSGNAHAKKETYIAGGNCNSCAQTLRSGTIVCELTSCQSGCQYVCRDTTDPIAYED